MVQLIRRAHLLCCAAAAAALASPASACMAMGGYYIAYFHSALPRSLPPELTVAEVELDPVPIVDDLRPLVFRGLPGRVRRMVQGDYSGRRIILRPVGVSSCEAPLANGTSGLVVGLARGFENGLLVVDPIGAESHLGFRLPDDYTIPKERLDRLATAAAALSANRVASPPIQPRRAFPLATALFLLPFLVVAAAAATLLLREVRTRTGA